MPPGVQTSSTLNISNTGFGFLSYNLTPMLPERRDTFGYRWNDSDSPNGPVYSWKDISEIGENVQFDDIDNGNSGYKSLWFYFNYYGNTYNYVRFSTNGWASFMNSPLHQWDNMQIPDAALPNNLMSAFFDDLTLAYGGNVYFYTNRADSAIITWQNVSDSRQEGRYTFQVILIYPDTIIYQYQNMGPARLNECSVGIENRGGTLGLQVAYNSDYIHNLLSTQFYLGPAPNISWLQIDNTNGILRSHADTTVNINIDASNLADGEYEANLRLLANDENSLVNNIPVYLRIESGACRYFSGDINHDGVINGSDVLYTVNYFKGFGSDPQDSCDCPPHGMLFVAADVNGSCSFNGFDITYLVNFLKGGNQPTACSDCPSTR